MAKPNGSHHQEDDSARGDVLTWAAMLGRWVDFAKSAVALPDDGPGRRMRESVADIIMIQAVWFALEHLGELEPDQRALGLDRAQVLVDKHVGRLEKQWEGETMPSSLKELVEDARRELARRMMKPQMNTDKHG